MASPYTVTVEALGKLGDFSKLDRVVKVAALRGVNRGAEWALPEASRRIRKDLNFTSTYLLTRLKISKKATEQSFEARITAQRRATSLARFVVGATSIGGAARKPGVTVMVEPGNAHRLNRAFLIRLRAGGQLTDTIFNLGLAIRLKPGAVPRAAYAPKLIGKSTWLLYGPSIQQAFINSQGGGEAQNMTPEIFDRVEEEFSRQLDLAGFKR